MIKKPAVMIACFFYGVSLLLFLGCATDRVSAPIYRVRVESGDSLASIARRYNTSWNDVARLNKIKDFSNVRVGQEILVCPGPGGSSANGSESGSSFLGELTPEHLENYLSQHQASSQLNRDEAYELKDLGEENPEDYDASNSLQSMAEIHMWPVHGDITSPFGPRGRRFHGGIDIRANKGTPIKASKAGKVIFAGRKRKYGKVIVLEHPDTGSKTLYAHCSKLLVKNNQWVQDGTVIGKVGATGNARGVHLHFEYRNPEGQLVNPLTVLTRSAELDLISFESRDFEVYDGILPALEGDSGHTHIDDFSDEEDVFYPKG